MSTLTREREWDITRFAFTELLTELRNIGAEIKGLGSESNWEDWNGTRFHSDWTGWLTWETIDPKDDKTFVTSMMGCEDPVLLYIDRAKNEQWIAINWDLAYCEMINGSSEFPDYYKSGYKPKAYEHIFYKVQEPHMVLSGYIDYLLECVEKFEFRKIRLK